MVSICRAFAVVECVHLSKVDGPLTPPAPPVVDEGIGGIVYASERSCLFAVSISRSGTNGGYAVAADGDLALLRFG